MALNETMICRGNLTEERTRIVQLKTVMEMQIIEFNGELDKQKSILEQLQLKHTKVLR